jgi:UDP-glucose 4-epimerase
MQIDGKRVLVTGGAGFIGSNLVDGLVARGCRVRVVDDLSVGREENLAEAQAAGDVEFVRADIRDRDAMLDAVDGIDIVMHLAVSCLRVSLYNPWESHEVNAGGTLAVLDAAKERGVERFLYCSSSEIYGTAQTAPMSESHPAEPTTVYGASKLAGERYALAYWLTDELPVLVVRPFNTYGYREHHSGPSGEVIPKMVVRALAGRAPVIFGDGEQTRDFTFVTDTVRGLIAACECDELLGDAVNVAYGREVTIREIAELVSRACGLDGEPEYTERRPADVDRHYADVTKARTRFGYEAAIPIDEGITRYVEWFRERHPDVAEIAAMAEREQLRNWEAAAR